MSDKPGFFVLQYWAGDRDRALRMARFFAQIQPEKSRHTFALIHRFDCEAPDAATLVELGRSFERVEVIHGTTRLTGHPNGCWALWRDSVRRFRDVCSEYDFGVFFEADCTPLWPDWAERIAGAVERSDPNCLVFGHHVPEIPGCPQHVNGNCGLRSDPVKLDRLLAFNVPLGASWDVYIFPFFASLGIASLPEIRSIYLFDSADHSCFDSLRAGGCALHHGDKCGKIQSVAFREVLGGPGYSISAPPTFYERNAAGRYIFDDPDGVPSLREQCAAARIGYREIAVQTADPDGCEWLRFNASIAADGRFAVRRQRVGIGRTQATARSEIEVGTIDLDTAVATVNSALPGPQDSGRLHTHYEDPRLSEAADGRPVLGFTRANYPPDFQRTQNGFWFGGFELLFPSVGRNSEFGASEKNWIPFRGPDPAYLDFVNTTIPFSVARVRGAESNPQILFDYVCKPARDWQAAGFGEPRGGTPAIYVPEFRGYLSMFHSSVAERGRGRRYFAGWLLFAMQPGGVVLRACSRQPVLRSSYADGFAWAPGERHAEPSDVFPVGLVRRADRFVVSAGVNDSFSVLLDFSVGSVQADLLGR